MINDEGAMNRILGDLTRRGNGGQEVSTVRDKKERIKVKERRKEFLEQRVSRPYQFFFFC